jgi:glycerol-3-phosphate cytidylyltransferase
MLNADEMHEYLERRKVGKKIVGFTASCFDLGPHAGHIAMLSEAKGNCDYLVVALQVDPSRDRPNKNKPVQSVVERAMALRACKYVDEVIPYETESDLIQLLQLLQPDVRFIGEDYIGKDFTGKGIHGIKIFYNSRQHSVSSSGIRKKIKES